MEDDLLWLNMIAAGAKTGNLDQILCKVRVGAGMFERRGGLRYLKLYRQARQRMLKRGQISYMGMPRVLPFRWWLPFVLDLSDSLFL